jgi:hypothetical protein
MCLLASKIQGQRDSGVRIVLFSIDFVSCQVVLADRLKSWFCSRSHRRGLSRAAFRLIHCFLLIPLFDP